jgi:hypothetical protein
MPDLSPDVLQSTEPVLLRGLVQHWPLVEAARQSDTAFCDYLRRFGNDTRLALWRGPHAIGGRFFYNDAFTGFNYKTEVLPFGALLDALLQPPAEADALYLGSTELNGSLPGLPGQPISLVDTANPDTARFPRYAEAQKHARVFELEPGDALFIPSQWWHGVESLADINGLVNFWWRQSPPFMDTPLNTLMMALLTLRDLPPEQRAAWRQLFDHYVFDATEETAAHIPAHARGVLASPIAEPVARQLRAVLLNRLNR